MTTSLQRKPALSITHHTFVIERIYPHPPARVFNAFADPRLKRRWFAEGDGVSVGEYSADFRVGGHDFMRFAFPGGPAMTNETIYFDIVPDRRLIFAYYMTAGDVRISASLATVELSSQGTGTRLVFTEQGAYLDGNDDVAQREQGSRKLLERLASEIARG